VVAEPLPVSYFLGVAYGRVDPQWLSDVLAFRPDGDTAAWLAWPEEVDMMAPATTWGSWLRLGLPRADVQWAVGPGLDPNVVSPIATAVGWSEARRKTRGGLCEGWLSSDRRSLRGAGAG